MSYNKIAQLLNLLAKKTKLGKAVWEETAKSGAFQISFSDYSVILDIVPNQENNNDIDYRIQIVNSNGLIIESAVDPDFSDILSDAYNMMKEMYETARRQVLGVEQALDSIIEDLSEEDIPF